MSVAAGQVAAYVDGVRRQSQCGCCSSGSEAVRLRNDAATAKRWTASKTVAIHHQKQDLHVTQRLAGLLAKAALACLLVSYCASSTEPVHVPYPGNGDQLDPARRFERDAVGRELVSRASRAVPAAPDGLGRPGRGKLRRRSLVAGRALPFYIERVVSEALFSVPPYGF